MISIIVPIYNEEKYLIRCVDSICGQTYADLEIILVEDGSTDSSGRICDEYVLKDTRIKVIHKENGGLVSARKAGIRAATGQYVGSVDGDDWIEPDMYEKLYHGLKAYNVDAVMCGRFDDTGSVSKRVYHGVGEGRYDKEKLIAEVYPQMIVGEVFFDWNIFPGIWDKLFKREKIIPYQMDVDDRIAMGEDAACIYPALLNVDSIYVMHECLYHYRQTTSSMIKSNRDYRDERVRFYLLYNTVSKSFEKYKGIYDLREQWLKYMLFLMLPRADSLYCGFDGLDYLFPFSGIKKGSRIVLYGAGTYGQRLYNYLEKTNFCHVVLWLDKNYMELQKMGLKVSRPDELETSDCDKVVIANTYYKSRTELYMELKKKYPDMDIYIINEELILSEQTGRAFGLL